MDILDMEGGRTTDNVMVVDLPGLAAPTAVTEARSISKALVRSLEARLPSIGGASIGERLR